MRAPRRTHLAAALAMMLAGCQAVGPGQKAPASLSDASVVGQAQSGHQDIRPIDVNLGNVTLSVTLPLEAHAVAKGYGVQALDSYFYSYVTSLRITVTGADITTPVVVDVPVANGTTSVSRTTNIPVGKNRHFVIEAYDHATVDHSSSAIAKIRAVADINAGASNTVSVNYESTPAGAVFNKLINDGRSGNATALNLAKTASAADVDAWVKTNLTRYDSQTGLYAVHPTLVDIDAIVAHMLANSGALPAAEAATGYRWSSGVTVTVRNRSNNAALEDATVILNDVATAKDGVTANAGGVYTLADVTPGNWKLTVTAPNREPRTLKVYAAAKSTASVTVYMDGDTPVNSFVGGGSTAYQSGISAENLQLSTPAGAAIFANAAGVACNYKDQLFFAENTGAGNIYRVNDDRTVTRISTGVVANPWKMQFDKDGNLWVVGGATLHSSGATNGGLFKFSRQSNGDLNPIPTKVIANHTGAIFNALGYGSYNAVGGFTVLDNGDVVFHVRNNVYGPASSLGKYAALNGAVSAVSGTSVNSGALADVAVDSANQIYKTSADGIQMLVTNAWVNWLGGTGAGVGVNGVDRTLATVKANNPLFLSFDASDALTFSDTDNRTLRKVCGNGKVYVAAGTHGSSNGFAVGLPQLDPAIRFGQLGQHARDSKGNLYVVDAGNSRIYRAHLSDGNTAVNGAF